MCRSDLDNCVLDPVETDTVIGCVHLRAKQPSPYLYSTCMLREMYCAVVLHNGSAGWEQGVMMQLGRHLHYQTV